VQRAFGYKDADYGAENCVEQEQEENTTDKTGHIALPH
jgi:hypothetical protein